MRTFSREIYDTIKEYLIEREYVIEEKEDDGVIKIGMKIDSIIKGITISFLCRKFGFLVYSVCPLSSKAFDIETMELITRINYSLPFACYEMDIRDGELRLRLSESCEEHLPTDKTLERDIRISCGLWEKYGEAIVKTLCSLVSAEEAIKEAEYDIPARFDGLFGSRFHGEDS